MASTPGKEYNRRAAIIESNYPSRWTITNGNNSVF